MLPQYIGFVRSFVHFVHVSKKIIFPACYLVRFAAFSVIKVVEGQYLGTTRGNYNLGGGFVHIYYMGLADWSQLVGNSKLVVASQNCFELGTAQPQLVIDNWSIYNSCLNEIKITYKLRKPQRWRLCKKWRRPQNEDDLKSEHFIFNG